MKKKQTVTLLAIESSCDETAASVLRGDVSSKQPSFEILSNVVKSQIALYQKMGGVVPETAARAHVANILPVVKKALSDAFPQLTTYNLQLSAINFIAPTTGPGLIASLIVGTEFSKGLAMATNKKMVAVNHMEGHLYSSFGAVKFKNQISNVKGIQFPLISLVVSGGHTMLVHMKDQGSYKVIGSTVDDAAGEAFDKVAKILGLPYPGGPVISKLAEQGKPSINFPRPMMNNKNYDFSFSGLKTAVLYKIKDLRLKIPAQGGSASGGKNSNMTADIARSFEDAVIDVLITKTLRAAKEYKAKTIALGGGVAANRQLRNTLELKSKILNLKSIMPPAELCTDNAAMIAIAAYFKLRSGYKPKTYSQLKADSSWEI